VVQYCLTADLGRETDGWIWMDGLISCCVIRHKTTVVNRANVIFALMELHSICGEGMKGHTVKK
jgi:hypothetical protein